MSKKKSAVKQVYSTSDIVKLLKVAPQRVRQWIEEGRVPFAVKIGGGWSLEPRSLAFLKKWRSGVRGIPGQLHAEKMRAAAAKLDPVCAERYEVWKLAYPHGWSKKSIDARREAKRSK